MYCASRKFLLLSVPVLIMASAGLTQAELPWQITVVEDGYRPGYWISLALFPEDHPRYPGQPAISHQDYIDYDLEFAWFDGAEWQRTTVDAEGSVGRWTSIAMFPMDHPDSTLAGQPAICYNDLTNADLKFAWLDAGDPQTADDDTWQTIVVPGPDGSLGGRWTSLIILPMNHPEPGLRGSPVISFGDYTGSTDLKLAWCSGDVGDPQCWHSVLIDTGGDLGQHTSLAMFPLDHTNPNLAGQLAVAHFDDTNDDLKFAWHSNGFDLTAGWQSATVPVPGDDVGRWASLTIFPMDHAIPEWRGQPAISYRDEDSDDLMYVRHAEGFEFSTGWSDAEVVDAEGNVGQHTSLAVLPTNRGVIPAFDGGRADLAGMPIISHYGNGDLKFAWFDGASWQTATLDVGYAWTGQYTSLKINSTGRPLIAYLSQQYSVSYVKTARFRDFVWEFEVADETHWAGEWPRLAVPGFGPLANQPIVSHRVGPPQPGLVVSIRDDDGWQLEHVDDREPDQNCLCVVPADHSEPAIAGQPVVAYGASGLRYAERHEDGTWYLAQAPLDTAGAYASLVIFPLTDTSCPGCPAISYLYNDDLKYIEFVGTDRLDPNHWQSYFIDTEGNTGYWTSLAIHSSGPYADQPGISYYKEAPDFELRFAWRDSQHQWHYATVPDTSVDYGEYSSLVLPATGPFTGCAVIAYLDDAQDDLKLAWCCDGGYDDPFSWHTAVVDNADSSASISLTVLPSGQPAVTYRSAGYLRYAWHEGSDLADPTSWQWSTLSAEGYIQYLNGTSLAVMPSGAPAIAYNGGGGWDLRFAEMPRNCDGWVNMYDQCEPDSPFAMWDGVSAHWGEDYWEFTWEIAVPEQSPYTLIGARSFCLDVEIDGVPLQYEGDGVWRLGDATATFVGADAFEPLSPAWKYLYCAEPGLDLAYPVIYLGDLLPGDVATCTWRLDWLNQPPHASSYICGEDFAYATATRAGDFDGDDDVDTADFEVFAGCLTGPQKLYGTGCRKPDLDGDADVDVTDFRTFQVVFTGP